MSPHTLATLRRLEGHHVAVHLRDGTRIEDCELVSAGRRGRGRATVWLLEGETDRIVAVSDIAALWQRG